MTGALSRWGSCQCLLSWDESLCCMPGGWGHQLSHLLDPVPLAAVVAVAAVTEVCVCVEDRKHATHAVCHSLHSNPHALRGYITQLWLCISIEIGLWKMEMLELHWTVDSHQWNDLRSPLWPAPGVQCLCKLAPVCDLVTLWHCHQDVCRSWYRWRWWWGECLRHANQAFGFDEGEGCC